MDRVGERVSPVSCPMLDAIHDDTINRNFTVSSVITLSYRATWIVKRFLFFFFFLEEEVGTRGTSSRGACEIACLNTKRGVKWGIIPFFFPFFDRSKNRRT